LGVDWGHLPTYENVKEKNKQDDVPEGWVVRSNSGQAAVAPAGNYRNYSIRRFTYEQKQADDKLTKKQESSHVVLDMLLKVQSEPKAPLRSPPRLPKRTLRMRSTALADRRRHPVQKSKEHRSLVFAMVVSELYSSR
jgi:hypothetical protein